MTTASHDTEAARAHLEEAREHHEAFQHAMRALGGEVRRLDEWQWHRVDAYPGWEGTRDVGAGVDMSGLARRDRGLPRRPGRGVAMPRDTPYLRSHGYDPRGPGADERMDHLRRARERDLATARAMRAEGHSLYAIHLATGRSKEWLRTYAGITDQHQGDP